MKDNYQAWEIEIDGFYRQKTDEDRLRFLIRFAVLAPSSHNSQPWKFKVGDKGIMVGPEMRRALPISDTNNRQLYISLGCAIENLLVAADYYGFATQINYQDDRAVISLQRIKQESSQDKNHLIFSIPKSHTNRNPYDDRTPDDLFRAWIKTLANDEMRVDCITDQNVKNKIADVVIAAGIAAMDNGGFRKELSRYVKPNITKAKIGMPAFGMGIPTPISLIAPLMLKLLNMNKLTRKQDEKLLKEQTPVFVIISTKEDGPKAWMRAGQTYERVALKAEQQNTNTAPIAAPIQIGEYYKELQRILQISFRPQVFFRLGCASRSTPHSPRLLAEEVTTYNQR